MTEASLMGNATVWFLTATIAVTLIAIGVLGLRFMRAASMLDAYLKRRYPDAYRWPLIPPSPLNAYPAFNCYRLDQIILGIYVPDIEDVEFRGPLKAARMAIAICGVAFVVAMVALGLIFRDPLAI